MQNTNKNENLENSSQTPSALPMQIGLQPGQVEELSEEISQTGVAQSEADVERLGVPGPETGENDGPTRFPVPIVTSD